MNTRHARPLLRFKCDGGGCALGRVRPGWLRAAARRLRAGPFERSARSTRRRMGAAALLWLQHLGAACCGGAMLLAGSGFDGCFGQSEADAGRTALCLCGTSSLLRLLSVVEEETGSSGQPRHRCCCSLQPGCPVGHESQCCRKVSEPARISPEMRVTVVLPAGVLWARGPGADGLEESLCYCGRARCESGLRPTGQQRGKAARATGCWRAAEQARRCRSS